MIPIQYMYNNAGSSYLLFYCWAKVQVQVSFFYLVHYCAVKLALKKVEHKLHF